jgi:hypothetical protein
MDGAVTRDNNSVREKKKETQTKQRKEKRKEPDLSLKRQNHRIHFQKILHGILDRLSPALVI